MSSAKVMTANLIRDARSNSPTLAQDKTALKQVFAQVGADSCPGVYNFHLHTTCSDGRLAPEKLMQQAFELQLQGLAITDHHSVRGFQRAKQWIEDWQWQHPRSVSRRRQPRGHSNLEMPHLWTGVEINAGLVGTEVHILGYAFNPNHHKIQPYLQGHPTSGRLYDAYQVISAIQAANGIAILAHPARYRQPADRLVPAAAQLGIDGVETYYAYKNPSPWQPSLEQTRQVKALADQHCLLSTCGTDTHGMSILSRL